MRTIFSKHREFVSIAILLLFAIGPILVQAASITVAWSEDFNDGELYNNPAWTIHYGGEYMSIIDGRLHANGRFVDDSTGRYISTLRTYPLIQTSGYLEFSFRGLLKSSGSPQEGRHAQMTIWDTVVWRGYHIAIDRGQNGSWPTDRIALDGPDHHPIVVTNYMPERDTEYEVRAVRQSGVWTLYVDGNAVGSAPDTQGITRVDNIEADSVGSIIMDDLQVRVEPPNSPPDCSGGVYPSTSTLWPANHQLVPIDILGITDPNGDAVSITINSIFQDEPTNGLGDGDTTPDGQGIGSQTASVRAERAGNGNGRVYHISFTGTDPGGASCSGEVLVSVPKSRGNNGDAVDDGALYDSTIP